MTDSRSTPDPREQMRIALERKRQTRSDAASPEASGRVPSTDKTDSHARGGKREFRRKSG